jgi:glycosyltransferase involved in cell wall biosynthesis
MLWQAGYDILLIGRKLENSLPIQRPYKTLRKRLLFNRGPLFYASLNSYLFFKVLFTKADLLWANDLDTLPANWLVSVLKGKPLIYDSHEFFTEVPEIQHKPLVKRIWRFFERLCIKRAAVILTVSPSIAERLKNDYKLQEVLTVRNIPMKRGSIQRVEKSEFGFDPNKTLLLLQGSGINMNRGGEELVEAMQRIRRAELVIIGGGDALPELKRLVAHHRLSEKVHFLGKMPYEEMMRYTAAADIGFSLDKSDNLNYQFSLPNKIFDYAMAGLPMITSDLPEVSKFVKQNDIGLIVSEVIPKKIAEKVNFLIDNPAELQRMRANASQMNQRLSWENEFEPVLKQMDQLQ